MTDQQAKDGNMQNEERKTPHEEVEAAEADNAITEPADIDGQRAFAEAVAWLAGKTRASPEGLSNARLLFEVETEYRISLIRFLLTGRVQTWEKVYSHIFGDDLYNIYAGMFDRDSVIRFKDGRKAFDELCRYMGIREQSNAQRLAKLKKLYRFSLTRRLYARY